MSRFHFRGALSWASHPEQDERERGGPRRLKKKPAEVRASAGPLNTASTSDYFAALHATVAAAGEGGERK